MQADPCLYMLDCCFGVVPMSNASFVSKIATIPKETKNETRGLLQTGGEFKILETLSSRVPHHIAASCQSGTRP